MVLPEALCLLNIVNKTVHAMPTIRPSKNTTDHEELWDLLLPFTGFAIFCSFFGFFIEGDIGTLVTPCATLLQILRSFSDKHVSWYVLRRAEMSPDASLILHMSGKG